MIPLMDLFLMEENQKEYRYSFGEKEVNGCAVLRAPETVVTLLHHRNRKIEIMAEGEVLMSVPCSRCLAPVETPVTYSLHRKVDIPTLTDDEEEAVDFIIDEQIDLDLPVRDELLMNFPMRVLCAEDCKGICVKCGVNLNLHTCACGKEAPDGPMAGMLKNLKLDIR